MSANRLEQQSTAGRSPRDWRRVVVKVGTNLLTSSTESLDSNSIRRLVGQIVALRETGVEVVLVTSGAVTAGRQVLGGQGRQLPRRGVATRQVLASLGQTPLMSEYVKHFAATGVVAGQALVSRGDLESDHGYLNARNTLLGLLQAGAVPVVNENDVVAVEELEGEVFGDNDRLSARVADVVDADALIILSDVDGLYDRDPHQFKDAVRLAMVTEITQEIRSAAGAARDGRGRGGMATKLDAAEMATSIGTAVVIASGDAPDVLVRLREGEDLGTWFQARTTKLESRKRRILASLRDDTGSVTVNAGAARALVHEGGSLLPPGITAVTGHFERGEYIAVRSSSGAAIAAGRSNYSSDDVSQIKGLRSGQARDLLETDYGDEVIHRNHMVIIESAFVPDPSAKSARSSSSKGAGPDLNAMGERARKAARKLATASAEQKNRALEAIAASLVERSTEVLAANSQDMQAAAQPGTASNLRDRLLLTVERIGALAAGVREIARLEDPVGEIIEETVRPNGLRVQRRRIPLGVIGVIYESRPNVTIDIAALCLKAGNAVILRGGSESFESNRKLAMLARDALESAGLPADVLQFIDSTDRSLVDKMLSLKQYIDLLIPRGGERLVRMVAEKAKMPAVTGGIGVCHTYVDRDADLEMAVTVIHNAKVQRPSVCNALDTIIAHSAIAEQLLPAVATRLWESGVELRCDRRSLSILEPAATTPRKRERLRPATDDDYDTEFLGLTAAVRIVDSLDDALDHIEKHGSNHTEAIITRDERARDRFLAEVDASAVLANASTRFNDGGEFGLGAEVAISTDKMHAYGPMGLKEITSYKWVVLGDGQVRT